MAKTFHCKLITPMAKVLDEEVVYASVPAWDGMLGVMAPCGGQRSISRGTPRSSSTNRASMLERAAQRLGR